MSLFKTIFWMGLVIMLLPSDPAHQRALQKTAYSASTQARSFCDARPNICVERNEFWELFKTKAAFGYALATELVWGQRGAPDRWASQSDGINMLLQSGFEPGWTLSGDADGSHS